MGKYDGMKSFDWSWCGCSMLARCRMVVEAWRRWWYNFSNVQNRHHISYLTRYYLL